jgi:hypothetical protein
MMNFRIGRKVACSLLCLFQAALMNAQLRVPFTELDASAVGLGFFFPQSHNTVKVPDPYSDQHILTASQCASLFMSFGRACLDSTHVLADFSGFREHKDNVAHSEGCWSMAMLDISYVDFRPDALQAGLVQRTDGQFHHSEGCAASPCLSKDALVLWVDAPHITASAYKFKMSADASISNYESIPASALIDFDDGLGWRPLLVEQVYDVDYSDELRDRFVRCELRREGYEIKRSACMLRASSELDPCATTTFPYPDFAPWTSDEAHPWDLQVNTNEGPVKGRAYTLLSSDGVFDKPFVFVEGIDFGLDRDGHPIHEEHRHGTFGWCEFTSGFQDPDVTDDLVYGYDDLHLMPELLQQIRDYGYDIVLVDFHDGAASLQQNAALVEEVIRLCNEYKLANNALVVSGASMGGVITRYALRHMELNGEDHCVRLWVSFDAPHVGAHIPRALQESIKFNLEHGQEQALLFRDRYLMRPAARQMLDVQVFSGLNEYEDWYGELDEMGYPQNCRKIAISNGLSNGEGLQYTEERMLDWNCDGAGIDFEKQYLYHEGGDAYNTLSLNDFYVLGDFRTTLAGIESIGDEVYFWLGGLLIGALDVIDIDHDMVMTPAGTINRDYAPGGKRNTLQTLAAAINQGVHEFEENWNADFLCDDVFPSDYNRDHAFVLSGSAVGITLDDPYQNLEQYMDEHAEENYFDRVLFAQGHNENHTELTEENLAFIADEVLGFDRTPLDTALTAQSLNEGVFNFGRPEFGYLNSIHVHDGGRLLVNAFQPTHFNESGDYLSTDNHFELSSLGCAPAVVRIDQEGVFEIGDVASEYRTAQVTLNRDSKMVVGNNGTLRIFEGSSLVVEEGASLEVLPGGSVEVFNGSVIIRAGANVHFMNSSNTTINHEITLSGSDARLFFDGGELHLDDWVTLSMSQQPETTGYLEVSPGTENVLHMQDNSKFKWAGKSIEQMIMRLTNGAHFQNANWTLGEIHLSHGKVDLTYNGALYTDASLSATDVHFYASDQWETTSTDVWIWFNNCVLDSCKFEHVRLHNQSGKTRLTHCDFLGIEAGFFAFEGRYAVDYCFFDGVGIEGNELQLTAGVNHSVFANDAHIRDWSDTSLNIEECDFSNGSVPCIEKFDGGINLRCNSFRSTQGIVAHNAWVNMSSTDGAGYNVFDDVPVCVELDQASDLMIVKGFNNFSGYTDKVFSGTMDTMCMVEDDCAMHWEAQYNMWGMLDGSDQLSTFDGLLFPTSDMFDVTANGSDNCSGYEMDGGCQILFLDDSPWQNKECPANLAGDRQLTLPTLQNEKNPWRIRGTVDGIAISGKQACVRCSVFDCSGRLLLMSDNVCVQSASSEGLVHEKLSPGLYFIRIHDSNNSYCAKVVIP